MKPQDIEMWKFYRMPVRGGISTIFILDLEVHKYKMDDRDMECEKWIYWDLSDQTFGSFIYLNESTIDGMHPVESLIAQRNMRDYMMGNLDESEGRIKRLLALKKQAITEFSKSTLLPDQPSKLMEKMTLQQAETKV